MVTALEQPTLDLPDTDLDDDFALFMVIENFNSPHCEAQHVDADNKVCTHQPTARFSSCQRKHVKVCAGFVGYVERCFDRGKKSTHFHCGKPCIDCWKLEPLGM